MFLKSKMITYLLCRAQKSHFAQSSAKRVVRYKGLFTRDEIHPVTDIRPVTV